jgi:hypothetical protein
MQNDPPAAKPPSSLINQALYEYSHNAESRRPPPINCLVRHLYRAALGVRSLFGAQPSHPLVLASSYQAKLLQNGDPLFLIDGLFGFTAWRLGKLHTCGRYRCFAAVVVQ